MRRKSHDALQHEDGDCDRARLAAFAAGSLNARDREQTIIHLADCGECRTALTLMVPEEGPPTSLVLPTKKAA